jgi:hypothetical protein
MRTRLDGLQTLRQPELAHFRMPAGGAFIYEIEYCSFTAETKPARGAAN